MPDKNRLLDTVISLVCSGIIIAFPQVLLSTEVKSEKEAIPWISESIQSGQLNQWIGHSKNEVKRAKLLLRQFDQQAVYTKDGRIQSRKMPDGTVEEFHYRPKKSLVSVWVTSTDGKFIEERLYYKMKLKSIMYADGTLKTLHYPDWNTQARPLIIDIFSHSKDQVRMFRYTGQGQLIAAYLESGREIPKGNLTDFQQLSHIIDPAHIQLGAK